MCYENNLKRMSSFYVNEVHLITMLLPYIERRIGEDCKVHTIFQNNLDRTVNLLLEKLNLKNEMKAKIKSIDWKTKEAKRSAQGALTNLKTYNYAARG